MFKKIFTLGTILFITMGLSGCYTSYSVSDVEVEEVNEPREPVIVYPVPVNPIIIIMPAPKPITKLREPNSDRNNSSGNKLRNSAGTNSRGSHSQNSNYRNKRRNSRG